MVLASRRVRPSSYAAKVDRRAEREAASREGEGSALTFAQEMEALAARAEAAELDDKRAAQLASGRCDLSIIATGTAKPFYAELTLERHMLFVVNSFKDDFRILRQQIQDPVTHEPIEQVVLIGKTSEDDERSYGVLKEVHQDVWYRLLWLWNKQGSPITAEGKPYVESSAYEIVRLLRGDDSEHHYRRARELIHQIASIPIVFKNVYTWLGMRDVEQFRLIADYDWQERRVNKRGQGGNSHVRIVLAQHVGDGFLAEHAKPLSLGVYESLGGVAVARLLYPFLDHKLASKDSYNVRLTTLAERVGLRHYEHRSKRLEKFQPALRALEGQPIQGDRYRLRVSCAEGKTDGDYVFVAKREARQLGLPGIQKT